MTAVARGASASGMMLPRGGESRLLARARVSPECWIPMKGGVSAEMPGASATDDDQTRLGCLRRLLRPDKRTVALWADRRCGIVFGELVWRLSQRDPAANWPLIGRIRLPSRAAAHATGRRKRPPDEHFFLGQTVVGASSRVLT